ncbi:MAG: WYL domain-containing protein [Clostridiaceae bacterium]|nr:WYL domain-containing protein [Clostridiaceae bacterium]
MSKKELKSDIMFNIFKILHKYSDEEHKLSQKEIIDMLADHYEMKPSRKVIRENILDLDHHLKDFGYDEYNRYDIDYQVTKRTVKTKKIDKKTGKEKEVKTDTSMYSDFHLNHLFTKGEISLLIDGLLFSKQIDLTQRKTLIRKLELLSSKYFKSRVNHISVISNEQTKNQSLFLNIEDIDDAIDQSKQISFNYNRYQVNESLQDEFTPQLDRDGEVKKYVVNPYRMIANNGRYYLMANHDNSDKAIYYRLDRMTNINILERKRKPIEKVKGLEKGFDLAKHVLEQVYMYSGKSISVTLRLKKVIINDFIDWFGPGHQFFDETEDEVSVKVTVNENAIQIWALQYGRYVRVLAPDTLVEKIKKDIKTVMENYQM